MAEVKKPVTATKSVKKSPKPLALPPVGSAKYKAGVLRGDIKE